MRQPTARMASSRRLNIRSILRSWISAFPELNVRTYVERDVREVLRVGDLDAFERFLERELGA